VQVVHSCQFCSYLTSGLTSFVVNTTVLTLALTWISNSRIG